MIHTDKIQQQDHQRLQQIVGLLELLDDGTRHAVLDCFSPEEQAAILAAAGTERLGEWESAAPLMESLLQKLQHPDSTDEAGTGDPDTCSLTAPPPDATHDGSKDRPTSHPRGPLACLLAQSDPGQLASFLKHEHPQLIAAVLGLCEGRQAHAILESLPMPLCDDVRHRWTHRRALRCDIATELRCELLNQLAHCSQETDTECRSLPDV